MIGYSFPASYGQERLWLASSLQPDSSAYNVVVHVQLPGSVDESTVTAALAAVTARHEALRTSLRSGAAGLEQVVHDEVLIAVAGADLRGLPAEQLRWQYDQLCLAGASIPIALDRPPLWRARLIRVADNEQWLVVVAHHAICDATSTRILEDELRELCQAAMLRREPQLPELPIQYADWAVWQREQLLTPARLEQQLQYWRTRLSGAPAVHSLPTDHPRPVIQSYAGGEVQFALPPGLADRVGALARRLRATPFHVYLAAYSAMLARLGGHPDVVIGVPVIGRHNAPVDALIGMFVNTVALRVDLTGDPSFENLTGQVARSTIDSLDHADVPLQRVVEELLPRRDPAVAPLYQLGFNHLPDMPLSSAYGTARDELTLVVSGNAGRLEYRTDLFSADTAQSMVDRYLRIIDAAVRAPGTPASRLPLLDATERELIVGRWSGVVGATAEAPNITVPELIMAQAARTPHATAVTGPGGTLTYGELAGRVGRLADRLRVAGAGAERLVAVALPRSSELVVAVLAVLAAGAGYVPVDPTLPAERIAFMLADSGASIVLTTAAHAPCVSADVTVVDMAADPNGGPGQGLRPAPEPAHIAYVIYTSGTTGRPKGAVIEHRSLANYVQWFVTQYGLGADDRVLASSSPSFDAFGIELFPVLVAGGALVVAPETAGFDADLLLDLAADHAVTMLAVTPAVLRLLADSPTLSRCTALRQVVCGGEQLAGELVRAFTERLPVPVHNLYGPTETTIDVAGHTCGPTDRHPGPVPIGSPVAGARLYVLDAAGEPVPAGVAGHLHVGGIPVGRGYLGRPALTADRFVPDPLGPPGSRLYRTGDLVRWNSDGVLSVLGRLDDQIKLRGHRIEPAEIETVLREQAGVRDAVVLAREDRLGDRRLVAYVVAPSADAATLRAALRRVLPEHMVPAAIVALEAFQLTAHGKLDADALPPPDGEATRTRNYVPPDGSAETLVAAAWAEVLGIERVGAEDDFFDVGGHSLLAARIAVRLADVVGVPVPIHLFFANPSVRALAGALERLLTDEIERLTDAEAEQLLVPGEQP